MITQTRFDQQLSRLFRICSGVGLLGEKNERNEFVAAAAKMIMPRNAKVMYIQSRTGQDQTTTGRTKKKILPHNICTTRQTPPTSKAIFFVQRN